MVVNKRKIVLAILLILAVMACFFLMQKIRNRRVLEVKTDVSGLKLEIDDRSYQVDKKTSLGLGARVYNYRAVYTVEGERIVLTGKINLVKQKRQELVLNFSIYNKQVVSKTLCDSYEGSLCPFTPDVLNIHFLENYSWAVVDIDSPSVGKGKAVMSVDQGTWKLIDGPGTDILSSGYYPESVERAIEND